MADKSSTFGSDTPTNQLRPGRRQLQQYGSKQGGDVFRQADRTPANDLDAFVLLASVKVKLSQWQEAEAVLQHILAIREDDAASLLALGHCQLELEQYQAAADTLERSLRLDPTQVLGHFYLSRAFRALGRVSEAKHEADLHKEMMEQNSLTLPKAQLQREKALADQARQLLSKHREEDAVRLFQERSRGRL